MERITHYFYDVVAANGYLWFLEFNMNALFKLDIKTSKMEFVSSLPTESTVAGLYRFTARCGNKLVCCPRNARVITVYDTDSNSMKTIEVDYVRHKTLGAKMYGDGSVGNKVYLLRQGYSKIYQLDVQSGELTVLNIIGKETELGKNDYFWHGRIRKYRNDSEILLYNLKYNTFYQYNILTSETKKIICFEEKQKIIDFVTDGYFIWGLCCDGRIYKLDGTHVIDEYQCDIVETDVVELLYYKNRIYVMNIETGRVISSLGLDTDEEDDVIKKIPSNNTGVFNYSFDEDDYFWIQWKDGSFCYYDAVNEVSGIFESDLNKCPITAFFSNGMCTESKRFSAQELLKIMKYQPDVCNNVSGREVGTHIYNTILTD